LHDLLNQFRPEASSRSLVCDRGIGVPIRDYHFVLGQCGTEHGANVLRTIGGEYQQFRERIDFLLNVEQGCP